MTWKDNAIPTLLLSDIFQGTIIIPLIAGSNKKLKAQSCSHDALKSPKPMNNGELLTLPRPMSQSVPLKGRAGRSASHSDLLIKLLAIPR